MSDRVGDGTTGGIFSRIWRQLYQVLAGPWLISRILDDQRQQADKLASLVAQLEKLAGPRLIDRIEEAQRRQVDQFDLLDKKLKEFDSLAERLEKLAGPEAIGRIDEVRRQQVDQLGPLISRLEELERTRWRTVRTYAENHGFPIDAKYLRKMGKKASGLLQGRNLDRMRIQWCRCKTYPVAILREVFNNERPDNGAKPPVTRAAEVSAE